MFRTTEKSLTHHALALQKRYVEELAERKLAELKAQGSAESQSKEEVRNLEEIL